VSFWEILGQKLVEPALLIVGDLIIAVIMIGRTLICLGASCPSLMSLRLRPLGVTLEMTDRR